MFITAHLPLLSQASATASLLRYNATPVFTTFEQQNERHTFILNRSESSHPHAYLQHEDFHHCNHGYCWSIVGFGHGPIVCSHNASGFYFHTDRNSFNSTSIQSFRCPIPFGLFCAGPSMSQNLLMKCEMGMPSPINCIEHTAGQAPIDDYNARCWESLPTSGDGACSKAGTVYPLIGNPFPLPAGSNNASLPDTPSIAPQSPTSYPVPTNLTEYPLPTATATLPADISLLPSASLPAYVTTVTIGTTTRWHTVFSDCGNGTMLYGTAPMSSGPSSGFAAWQTGSVPGYLSSQPTVVPNTIPCNSSTSSDTSTVSWAVTPTGSTAEISFAHPSVYVASTPSPTLPAGSTSSSSASGSSPTPSAHGYPSSGVGNHGSFDSGDGSSSAASVAKAPSFFLMAASFFVLVAWVC